jgi:hypothetical protein
MTVWDWLKQVTYIREPWDNFSDEDKESFNVYMLHKVISMHEPYIELVNIAQRIPYTEKEKTYKFYCSILPKKPLFLKYIKSSRKKMNEQILQYIATYFEVSLGEAEDYIYILKKEGVEYILERKGIEEKLIKKLLKEI